MKLHSSQLEAHLSKKLSTIYIVSGEELLLKQDAIKLIRKAAAQAGYSEKVRITPEAGYDWEQLHTLLNATSLFAEKRLIECDFRDITPPKTASTILQEYSNNPAVNNILLIDIAKLDDKIAKSAWFKALDKHGITIAIWPIPREQLPQWIIQRAKKFNVQLTLDAANLLTDYVEGNLTAAAQTIEKIYLLQPQKQIDANEIQVLLTDESRFTIFDFTDAIISKDKSRSLHILENLKEEGTEPVLILWGITRELRMLADLAQQIKNGMGYENLFQQYRVFSRRQSSVKQFLSRTTVEECWHHLTRAAEIDKMIKGATPGNVWESLQLFCLRLV